MEKEALCLLSQFNQINNPLNTESVKLEDLENNIDKANIRDVREMINFSKYLYNTTKNNFIMNNKPYGDYLIKSNFLLIIYLLVKNLSKQVEKDVSSKYNQEEYTLKSSNIKENPDFDFNKLINNNSKPTYIEHAYV